MADIVLYKEKSECCGCSACASVCPNAAIGMREDNEGFLYPAVDQDKCVRCGQCVSVCPIRKRNQAIRAEKKVPHIGILNLQNTMNYGASIAAVVLQDTVQSLVGSGTRVVTIDYDPSYQGSKAGYLPYFVKMNNGWINCIRGAFRRIFRENKTTLNKERVERKHRFQQFHARFLRLSDKYRTPEDFSDGTDWRAFIVGSDIVWHPKRITTFQREVFFFGFADGIRRISYAASTDSSNDALAKYRELYAEGMKSIDCISVREESNIAFLQPLTDKPITVCCDPAFLYTADQYELMLAQSAFKPAVDERYIYVNLLDRNDFMVGYAKKFAKEKNLKLYFYATKYPELSEFGENCTSDGPAEFLARLRYAAYVLTNSFHCAVFSLIFHKKFLSFERGKTSIKSYDLLSQFDLLNRIVTGDHEKDIEEEIDFDRTDHVIQQIKEESIAFLKGSLEPTKVSSRLDTSE